ncbi:MAG: DUF2007 domain-containing protein [Firmicutes bacterium]|nr:DUF2007 domain-containing protein [Bacillota bacterium]
MAFCPSCKAEYREGFTVCADCGETLVEKLALPPEKPEEPVRYEKYEKPVMFECPATEDVALGQPVLLYSGADDVNANILLATLKDHGIPVFLKRRGAGDIYIGRDKSFAVEIYVQAAMLDRAREILNYIIPEESMIEDFADDDPANLAEDMDEESEAELNRVLRNERIALSAMGLGFILLFILVVAMLLFIFGG